MVILVTMVAPAKEPLSEMKEHKKLIEKGKPEDVPVGHRFRTVSEGTDRKTDRQTDRQTDRE